MTTTRQIIFRQDEDGYWNKECPSLPRCFSQGDTFDECVSNMKEAIEAYIESLEKGLTVDELGLKD